MKKSKETRKEKISLVQTLLYNTFSRDYPAFEVSENHIEETVNPTANLVDNDDFYYGYEDFVAYLEQRHATEQKVLTCIQTGNIHELQLITKDLKKGSNHIYSKRADIGSLRNMQDISITSNSLALRAALKGGLPVIIGYQLSNAFAVRIERSLSVETLSNLITEINETYCTYVREYANPHYSKVTQKAIDYVLYHMTSHVTVNDIAESLFINPSYLSRVFKEDTGQGLLSFINHEKIKQAILLIQTNQYSLTQISVIIGFNSYNNFAKIFKKIMGESPRDFSKSL